MVFKSAIENPIVFNYSWTLDDKSKLEFKDVQNERSYSFNSINFYSSVSVKDKAKQTLEVNYLKYEMQDQQGEKVCFSLEKKDKEDAGRRGYALEAEGYQLVHSPGRVWAIPYPIRFYGFPDEAVAYYQNTGFIQEFNLQNEILFSKIFYLGPLRTRAKRLYTWTGRIPQSVGDNGLDAVFAILAEQDGNRKFNLYPKGHTKTLTIMVATMLKKMGLIEDFKISQISDRQDYDVKVRTKGTNNFVGIPDVGVGISQVLPVIVELFYAPPGSTIIIEQPELHLHPSAQAALADVIIDAINARENEKNRNIQLIIETYSEHLLRRLQLRVAQEKLRLDALRAYFINTDKDPRTLEDLQVDLFGNISNWPKDFFGDLDGDIFDQTDAALRRRMEKH